MQLPFDRRFQHLENPGLVLNAKASLLGGGLAEFDELPPAPFRLHIAGRRDGHERLHPLKTPDQRVGEVVVALELRVPPDARLLAVELRDTSLQRPMEARDPAFVPLDQLDVVEVRVADEGVPFEVHKDLRREADAKDPGDNKIMSLLIVDNLELTPTCQ